MNVWPDFVMWVVGYLAIGLAAAAIGAYRGGYPDEVWLLIPFWPLGALVFLFIVPVAAFFERQFSAIRGRGEYQRQHRREIAFQQQQEEAASQREIDRIIAEHRL